MDFDGFGPSAAPPGGAPNHDRPPVPNLLTGTEPGELFILRNAGNLVPPHGAPAGGEAATVEYAVAHLKVRELVVCGHSHCGAVAGVRFVPFGTTIANLGMTDVKFPHPLFEGDTVHCTTEVMSKRESTSRPGAGILEFHHRAYNQNNKLVAECRRQVFMRMRPS